MAPAPKKPTKKEVDAATAVESKTVSPSVTPTVSTPKKPTKKDLEIVVPDNKLSTANVAPAPKKIPEKKLVPNKKTSASAPKK